MHLTDEQIQNYLENPQGFEPVTRDHLDTCPACQKKLEYYRLLFGALDSQSDIYLSANFADRVVSALPELPERQEQYIKRPIKDSYVFAAAMILVLIGTFVFLKPLSLFSSLTGLEHSSLSGSQELLGKSSETIHSLGISPELLLSVIGVMAIIALVDQLLIKRLRRNVISLLF